MNLCKFDHVSNYYTKNCPILDKNIKKKHLNLSGEKHINLQCNVTK